MPSPADQPGGFVHHSPATNTDAVVSFTEPAVITSIVWSYAGGTPSGGSLKIEINSVTVLEMDIEGEAHGHLEPSIPFSLGDEAEDVDITLSAGGASVQGRLTAYGIKKTGPGIRV